MVKGLGWYARLCLAVAGAWIVIGGFWEQGEVYSDQYEVDAFFWKNCLHNTPIERADECERLEPDVDYQETLYAGFAFSSAMAVFGLFFALVGYWLGRWVVRGRGKTLDPTAR